MNNLPLHALHVYILQSEMRCTLLVHKPLRNLRAINTLPTARAVCAISKLLRDRNITVHKQSVSKPHKARTVRLSSV